MSTVLKSDVAAVAAFEISGIRKAVIDSSFTFLLPQSGHDGSGLGSMAPRSLQTSQQVSQRNKLFGRIDGRTFKSRVSLE